jgi:hypothetical protein
MAIYQQLLPKDAVENVDCKTREDCSGKLNSQSIPLGQHFAATMPRFHKPVGVNHVGDAVGGKEYEDSAPRISFQRLFWCMVRYQPQMVAPAMSSGNGDFGINE